jgi:acyl carrier protein
MKTRDQIRRAVTSLLHRRGDAAPFQDADSLIQSGRLESLAVMELVTLLESTVGIDFSLTPFDARDFDSVDSILALVEREADTQPLIRYAP